MTTNANETKLNNKEQQAVFYPTSAQLLSEDAQVYDAAAVASNLSEETSQVPQASLSGSTSMTTYSWRSGIMSNGDLHTVGFKVNENGYRGIHRMYMDFNLPTLPNNPRIKKAEISFAQESNGCEDGIYPKMGLYSVTGEIQTGLCTPTESTQLIDFAAMKTGTGEEGEIVRYAFDITSLVDGLVKGESSSRKLVLRLINESVTDNNHITLYGSTYEETYAPKLVITYESSYGVNTSYRTHTHEMGHFGQGSVDLACGNLMFDFEDFAWSGNRMPVSIHHLYNSALADYDYTNNTSIGLNVPVYSAMKLGKGFKLNLMQSMRVASFMYNGERYIGQVYIGENGEETYFKLSEKTKTIPDSTTTYSLYEDVESGTLYYDPYEKTMETDGVVYTFDSKGRLVSITENEKRAIASADIVRSVMTYTYTEDKLTSVSDGAGRIFTFQYNETGFLTSITAPDGTKVQYTYTGELLNSVIYPDNRKAVLSYTGNLPSEVVLYDAEGNAVYKTAYAFDGDKLSLVTEYGKKPEDSQWTLGVSNSFTYSAASGRTVVLTTEPKDEAEGETEDTVIRTVYTFDDEGNVVSEYGDSQDASGIAKSINLLKNHGFEDLSEWTGMPGNAEDFVIENIDVEGRTKYGKNALRLSSPNTDGIANGVCQSVENLPAGSYTFSAYFHSLTNFSGDDTKGAYLRVIAADGSVLAESEHHIYSDVDFIRLVAPFELTSSQTVSVQILMNGKNTVNVDAAQLENKPYVSPYNLLENGSFEERRKWLGVTGENYTEEECFKGQQAMKMPGNLNIVSYVKQQVNVRTQRQTRETFILSGWAKGYGLPDHERENVANPPQFGLRAEIHYDESDGGEAEVETFTAEFSPCTEEWQYASVEFAKTKYRKVKYLSVYCDYGYNQGPAYFDDIQLVRTDIETGLLSGDFNQADDMDTEEDVETTTETTNEAPEFTEAEDVYGNALTETVFTDGEFGTMYRSFGYDNAGNNLVKETDARGNETLYIVDEETSRNQAVIDRCGNKTAYEYDDAGKLTKVTSAKPQYDENGEKRTDADGEVIYDELANVSYCYDAFDNMTEIVRGDGMKYVLGYNAFHNLETIGVEGKPGNLVKYTYKNGNGRLKAITYANGHTMKVSYNSAGQMTSEKWYETEAAAASQTATPIAHYKYVYDGQGNIVRSIDMLASKEYDYLYEDDRLIRATESDITLSGEIVTAKTVVNTIRYYYDEEGQLERKVISPAGDTSQVIYYEHSEDNTSLKFYAGGRYVTSHSKNDSFGRKEFDELQVGTGFVSRQFNYHTGEVTDEHIENEKLKSSPITQLVSNIVFSDGRILSYEYDAEERITKVTDTLGETETVTEYTYDALGQLLTEKVNGVVVNAMTYDNYGNILSKNGITYTYGNTKWKDLLTRYGNQNISYDAQGNPINYLGNTLAWEKGRQLKQFAKADGTVINYTYNANGIRTSKTVNGVKHTYTLDGTKILCEAWTKNGVAHSIKPMYDNEDSVCGIQYNGVPYYFQKNLQGDIIAIVDKEANTVVQYTYDAWGVCTINQDISGCGIAQVNPYRYRGYYYDAEIEMYYLQSRYYEPVMGRFVNGDMVEVAIFKQEVLEHNLFGYCSNNAIMNVDYNGYWKEYWGTFNSKQVESFTLKLDNKRKEIKKKFGWVAWTGIAIAIVGAIVGAIFLSPAGGAVLGIGITLCTAGIQMLVDLYPNELDNIANSIRNALKKSKKKILKIYFLWGSHTNQIKITDNVTNKTYKIITICTNAIQDLVTFAKNSNVKISSRDVKWQYSY